MTEKIEAPLTIESNKILDPKTRYVCTRLDKIIELLQILVDAENKRIK